MFVARSSDFEPDAAKIFRISVLCDMFQNLPIFLKEARTELKKVTWPSREETTRYTVAVIAISLAIAGLLGGADFIFKTLLTRFVI